MSEQLVFYRDTAHPMYETTLGRMQVYYTRNRRYFCYALAAPMIIGGETIAAYLRRKRAYFPSGALGDCVYLRSRVTPGPMHLRHITGGLVTIALEVTLGELTRITPR